MLLRRLLFPQESRHFRGQRWINISLRTLHLIGLAGLGGGFLYPAAGDQWKVYLDLVLWSGIGLLGIAVWNNGVWLLQLRGQAILLKLVLLGLMPLFPDWRFSLLLLIVVLSGVVSHAPASVRYYSFYPRREL